MHTFSNEDRTMVDNSVKHGRHFIFIYGIIQQFQQRCKAAAMAHITIIYYIWLCRWFATTALWRPSHTTMTLFHSISVQYISHFGYVCYLLWILHNHFDWKIKPSTHSIRVSQSVRDYRRRRYDVDAEDDNISSISSDSVTKSVRSRVTNFQLNWYSHVCEPPRQCSRGLNQSVSNDWCLSFHKIKSCLCSPQGTLFLFYDSPAAQNRCCWGPSVRRCAPLCECRMPQFCVSAKNQMCMWFLVSIFMAVVCSVQL